MGTFESPRRDRRGDARRARACGGPVRPIFGEDEGRGAKPDYKTAALCKQARRALAMTLAGECGDPVLQELIVENVLPAPHAGRLLVVILWRGGASGVSTVEVLERLAKVEGLLRARIGEAIVRKRTPEIAFQVIPIAASPWEADGVSSSPYEIGGDRDEEVSDE